MDRLDAKIIRELASTPDFRESYASMAERLGVDEETLRKRVKRLQGQEFESLQLSLNPSVLGREVVCIELRVDDEARKPAMISQIKLVDGVVQIVDFHGKEVEVVLWHEGEQDLLRKVQLISSICGDEEAFYWPLEIPRSNHRLRKTDWQILKAMRKEPRKSLLEIAAEIRASVRTVKRRLALMTKENVSFLPIPSFKKSPTLSISFLVHCPDHTKKKVLDNLLQSKF